MPPASTRSAEARSTRSISAGGPVTTHRATGARIERFAAVFSRRTATSTSVAAASVSGPSGPSGSVGVRPSPPASGHGARWIDPSCHQDHASSVQ